jgi:glutamyl-tRNA(Gln) amidotransferase subunit D
MTRSFWDTENALNAAIALIAVMSMDELENYSKEIQKILKKKGIQTGDKISVEKSKETIEGLLMPKSAGDPEVLVVKLDSGYNMGINFDSTTKLKVIKKHERKKPAGKVSFDKTKPPISLITTGGTITSKIDYNTGGVTSLITSEELLLNMPELAKIVYVRDIITPFTKMSEDMDYRDWESLSKLISKELNKGNEGVLLTHGTDVLHFTSAALSFMLKNLTKPVVLVGAQRSSDRGSSDTAMNLVCATYAALSEIAEVGICMHGTINDDYCLFIRGTKVRKMHTSRRDAFRPINDMPLAKITPSGSFEIINKNYRKKTKGKVKADTKFQENVSLLKVYPGSDPSIMDYLLKKGCRGFVLEATALGHVPVHSEKSWIPSIKSAIESGIPVIITSQSLYGRVDPYVYSNLRILSGTGAIFGEDMLPETAYVKLGWVLGHTKNMKSIKEDMLKNMAGEITERIDPETFLY